VFRAVLTIRVLAIRVGTIRVRSICVLYVFSNRECNAKQSKVKRHRCTRKKVK